MGACGGTVVYHRRGQACRCLPLPAMMGACTLRHGSTYRALMRSCTLSGGNRRGRLNQAREFRCLGVRRGDGCQESGGCLRLYRLQRNHTRSRRRRGFVVIGGNDGLRGGFARVGRCHIDAVRLVGAHDQDRRDDSRSELAGSQQAPGLGQRRSGESSLRHACRSGSSVDCRCRRRRRANG